MVETTRTAPVSLLAPEFDDFLFAPIGEDRNGMLLSVVSALARLDVDPWQEAADLARSSRSTATRRLAALIGALPERPSAHLDSETIAARLVALLPHLAGSRAPVAATVPGVRFRVRTMIQSPPFRYVALIMALFVLGSLGIVASRQSAAHVDSSDVPAGEQAVPQVPASASDR